MKAVRLGKSCPGVSRGATGRISLTGPGDGITAGLAEALQSGGVFEAATSGRCETVRSPLAIRLGEATAAEAR
jgi:hypothetical protein